MKGFYTLIVFLSSVTACFAQSAGDFRSFQTGNWNDVNAWERFDGTSWITPAPTTPTKDGGIITVAHSVTVTANVSADQLTVRGTGQITINPSVTFSIAAGMDTDLVVNAGGVLSNHGILSIASGFGGSATVVIDGILNNAGTINGASTTRLSFGSGATYDHNQNGGTIPTGTWNAASMCKVTGSTSAGPSGLNQTFGHFTWSTPSLSAGGVYNLALTGTSVFEGDFKVEATGTDILVLSDGTETISFNANFVVNGTSVIAVTNSGSVTANIAGDLAYSSSSDSYFANTGVGNINLSGDFSFSAGRLFVFDAGGSGTMTFNGTGLQVLTDTGGSFNGDYDANVVVSGTNLAVNGEGAFDGDGDFTLRATSMLTLRSQHASGAIQLGSSGNIQVSGTRTFEAGSTIVYGATGSQFIGGGHPSETTVHTIIDNPSGVTLASNAKVTGDLTLTSGNLSVASHTLTLAGNLVLNTNFLNVTTSSSLVIEGIGPFGVLNVTGSTTINNFTLNRSTSGSITLGSDLTIGGTLTQTIGDIILNGHSLSISGPYSRVNGSLNVDPSSSIIISGTGVLPSAVTFAGDQVLNTLTVNRSGATLATNSSLTITNLNLFSGTFDNTGTITIATGGVITRTEGSFINNTPSAVTTYDIVYNIATDISTGSEIPSVASALRHVTKTGGALLTLDQALTINGDFTLSNGSFNAGSFPLELKGNFIANAVSTLTGSLVAFSGSTAITGGSPVRFGNVLITGSLTPQINIRIDGNLENNGTLNAGTATTTFGGTSAITGTAVSAFNNILISGSLTAPSSLMNVAGSFTNNGSFSHNQGTVGFNGNTTLSGSATTSLFGVSVTGTFTAPSTSLNIAGNFSNTGTFVHNGGTIVFNGTTSSQSLSGTFTLNNVNISNPSRVNNNGTIDLVGTLSLVSSGAFDADGSGSGVLTVKSTAVNAGGRIAALGTPGNFTGLVTIERFVNGPQGWRYLSMPLTNGNVGMWQSIFPVTGNFSNPSPVGVNNVTSSTAPSIYYWNSTTQAYVAVGAGGTTASTNLNNLVGYSPYTYRSDNFTVSARGNIRTGSAAVPVASSGFALVPNPYPSAIDWDNINRTGFSSTMSIRVANNVFASYVAGGLSTNAPYQDWTGEVAQGQSFWVESLGATSLNMTESAKTGAKYQFLRDGRPENYLRIALSSDKQRDEALIWFVEGASAEYDATLDARKMRNGYFNPGDEIVQHLNLSTQTGENRAEYAINAVAPLSCNSAIQLKVRDIIPGNHTLEFSDMETLSLGYQVVLVDHYSETEKILNNGSQYHFDVSEDSASFSEDRFTLRFLMPGSAYVNSQTPPAISIDSSCDSKTLSLSVDAQQDVYYQFMLDGEGIGEGFTGDGSKALLNVAKSLLPVGINELDLHASTRKGCEQFVYEKALLFENISIDSVYISQEKNSLTSSTLTGNQWFKDGGLLEGETGQTLEVFESGVYTVQVSFGGCIVNSEEVEVQIDPFGEEFFKVFPNPTADKFILVLPDDIQRSLKGVSLHDLKGIRILDEETHPELLSSGSKTIDLTHVEKGLYMLSIRSGDKMFHLKVIKK